MTINEYQGLAMRTSGAETSRDRLVNGVMGLNGEAGEVIDIVKKHLFQGHPLEEEKIIDELGDVMWYIASIATSLNMPLELVLEHNIAKLKKRYPEGFSEDKSVNR